MTSTDPGTGPVGPRPDPARPGQAPQGPWGAGLAWAGSGRGPTGPVPGPAEVMVAPVGEAIGGPAETRHAPPP